jgi:hypothetical protein
MARDLKELEKLVSSLEDSEDSKLFHEVTGELLEILKFRRIARTYRIDSAVRPQLPQQFEPTILKSLKELKAEYKKLKEYKNPPNNYFLRENHYMDACKYLVTTVSCHLTYNSLLRNRMFLGAVMSTTKFDLRRPVTDFDTLKENFDHLSRVIGKGLIASAQDRGVILSHDFIHPYLYQLTPRHLYEAAVRARQVDI